MKTQAIIIEDSRLAQNELLELLKPYDQIEIVCTAATIAKATELVEKNQPELLFLDINLPDGTGFDLLDQLGWCPKVIFTTAYDEFAIKAFELNALDYLLKPISQKRFNQCMDKVFRGIDPTAELPVDHKIFVKENDRCWLVDIEQVRYFQSNGNYTHIHFDQFQPLIYKSLNKIQQRLPEKQFFRTNRRYIVNVNFIKKVENYGATGLLLTMDDGLEIDVSRRHSSHFKQMLSF